MIVTLSPCVTPMIASNWCVVVRSNHPETLPPNDDKYPLEHPMIILRMSE